MDRDRVTRPFRKVGAALGSVRNWSLTRKFLGTVFLLVVVAGILVWTFVPASLLGLATSSTATLSAAPAAPQQTAVENGGYELVREETITKKRSFTVVGQKKTVVVENQLRLYRHNITVQNETYPSGVFATVTTPAIVVGGEARNPIADMSAKELLERFGSQLTDQSSLSVTKVGTREAVMAGKKTTLTVFETKIKAGGEKRTVAIYVGKVQSRGDIVLAIGLYPKAFADERVAIMRMFYSVEHPAGE